MNIDFSTEEAKDSLDRFHFLHPILAFLSFLSGALPSPTSLSTNHLFLPISRSLNSTLLLGIFTMPATTTQNTTRPQQSGTPRPRSSGQETPRSGSRQTPSRGRYSSSNPPPSNHRRASVEHTRPQSTIKNPAQRNGLQVHYYPAKSAQDSDVTSVSSTPTAAKKEGRQPARSVRSDKSVRDESPTKGTSSSKGSNLKKDKVVAIKRAIEGELKYLCYHVPRVTVVC